MPKTPESRSKIQFFVGFDLLLTYFEGIPKPSFYLLLSYFNVSGISHKLPGRTSHNSSAPHRLTSFEPAS